MIGEAITRLSALPNVMIYENEEHVQETAFETFTEPTVIVIRDVEYSHTPRELAIKTFADVDTTLNFTISIYEKVTDGEYITACEGMYDKVRTGFNPSRPNTQSQMFYPVETTFGFDQSSQLANVRMTYTITYTEVFGT